MNGIASSKSDRINYNVLDGLLDYSSEQLGRELKTQDPLAYAAVPTDRSGTGSTGGKAWRARAPRNSAATISAVTNKVWPLV